jgi:tRNA dimethylallyltransferase
MVGLGLPRATLRQRIAERARGMVERGMMDEVKQLLAAGYDEALPSMGGIGYREFCAVLRARTTADEALRLMIRDTTRYAKRQMTWFAREPELRWIDVERAGGVEGTARTVLRQLAQEGLIE